MTYLYPDHLRARATLWLWDLRDIGFIGIGAVSYTHLDVYKRQEYCSKTILN